MYTQVYMHTMDLYEVKINLMLSHAVLDGGGVSCVCRLRSAEQKKGEKESEWATLQLFLINKAAVKDTLWLQFEAFGNSACSRSAVNLTESLVWRGAEKEEVLYCSVYLWGDRESSTVNNNIEQSLNLSRI